MLSIFGTIYQRVILLWLWSKIFTGQKLSTYEHLHRAHVWGCPVYVLDPALQDGKKWKPRSRRGMYLGISPSHSSTVGRILNLHTGFVSPQYHVVYDDLYSTVPNAESGGILNEGSFDAQAWSKLVVSGFERNLDMEFDQNPNGIPPLSPDWFPHDDRRLSAREGENTPVSVPFLTSPAPIIESFDPTAQLFDPPAPPTETPLLE